MFPFTFVCIHACDVYLNFLHAPQLSNAEDRKSMCKVYLIFITFFINLFEIICYPIGLNTVKSPSFQKGMLYCGMLPLWMRSRNASTNKPLLNLPTVV